MWPKNGALTTLNKTFLNENVDVREVYFLLHYDLVEILKLIFLVLEACHTLTLLSGHFMISKLLKIGKPFKLDKSHFLEIFSSQLKIVPSDFHFLFYHKGNCSLCLPNKVLS